LLAERFEPFTFSPTGAALYQLGPFGTAAKKLKEWDLEPYKVGSTGTGSPQRRKVQ
jgi:hypothetical protein